ncbi:hypothetical protein [Actinocrinis sp.]
MLDNRGVCQHAGYCTDRLAIVFRTSEGLIAPLSRSCSLSR